MAYCGFEHLGSWAGDLAQMTANIKNTCSEEDDLNKIAKEMLCGESQFTEAEMKADLDAININAILRNNKEIDLSKAIPTYYYLLDKYGADYRYKLFIEDRLQIKSLTHKKLSDRIYGIIKKDITINVMLKKHYQLSFDDDENYLNATVNAFVDYIYDKSKNICSTNSVKDE